MDNFNITSAQYTSTKLEDRNLEAVIDGQTVFVPINASNRHYAAIKAKHDDANDSFTIQDAS